MKRLKSILENVIIVVLVLILALMIYNKTQISQNPYPDILGIRTFTVLTGSMRPSLNPGDIVIVKDVDSNNLRKGDVITFKDGQVLVTHRIDEVVTENGEVFFRTKGDANNTTDSELVDSEQILGRKILKIPYAGYVIDFIKKPAGIVACGIFVMLIILSKKIIAKYTV